jgi:hypothetical protein
MSDELINIGLVTVSSAYAAWLAEHKHAEPDAVWVEVAVGVGYTLLGARLKRRADPSDLPAPLRWAARDAHIYSAFAYSSIPIIVGELAQWVRRRETRRRLAERWRTEV